MYETMSGFLHCVWNSACVNIVGSCWGTYMWLITRAEFFPLLVMYVLYGFCVDIIYTYFVS